ncbi:hypothetical protein LWI29_031974 [Acer saccharum]|uniref:glutamate--tRNA ligase n=1 Tax=Acer saccharum TaxID=4024 RepID=A0AA39SY25_ACESA|nr:hypothetical protein LWI29_031974 [Acer saccharum]
MSEIKKLSFPADSSLLSVIAAAKIADIPLLSVIAAAKLADIPLSMDTSGAAPTFIFSNGLKWREAYVLLRYIGRVGNLYGQNEYECGQIDEWLEYALAFLSGSEFETASNYVDMYLEKRTLLVGDCLSIADIAIWSALVGIRQTWESLRKYNLARWFNSICAEYSDSLNEITATYVGKRGLGKSSSRPCFEVDLPDAEIGKVRLRFAPEPSGYLHIGHSKAALLNQYFAQRYQGQLIVRFDDTNPAKESNEFVDNILKDIETLGIKYEAVTYTSDYFPDLMEMAETLIRRGKAYVDDTPREEMQRERLVGIESKCRNNSVEENMKLWKEMIVGSQRGLQCCLRGKLDMQDPNKSLRDPVYYRCNPLPHHRIGSKYKIYPTYDFACPFVDARQGISHALRSSEYHDRNAQYCRIQEDMGMRKIHIYEFSRLNMVYTLLSKRNLLWFVQNGKVDGWDDPRFPTIQGIVRRGQKEYGSVKTTKLKLTWLPITSELVNLILVGFDYLITKKKLEEGENFIDVLNPCTRFESPALGDSDMRNLKPGEVLQLERKGYFICDVPFTTLSKPIVLFSIPDGRQQAVLK